MIFHFCIQLQRFIITGFIEYFMAYSSLRIDKDTLNLLREIKTRMEREYVRPLSFDFVLKKIIEKDERKIVILT